MALRFNTSQAVTTVALFLFSITMGIKQSVISSTELMITQKGSTNRKFEQNPYQENENLKGKLLLNDYRLFIFWFNYFDWKQLEPLYACKWFKLFLSIYHQTNHIFEILPSFSGHINDTVSFFRFEIPKQNSKFF